MASAIAMVHTNDTGILYAKRCTRWTVHVDRAFDRLFVSWPTAVEYHPEHKEEEEGSRKAE